MVRWMVEGWSWAFRLGESVALEIPRDEGKTADDARGTTDDLFVVNLDSVDAFIVLEGLLSLIRFDLLTASSWSISLLLLLCSSRIISVGACCMPQAATGAEMTSYLLRLPPVTSTPLSALPNQVKGAVTMFLMAPRKEELWRTSLEDGCPLLVDIEEDDENAMIIIHNESLLTRGQRKERKLAIKIQANRSCITLPGPLDDSVLSPLSPHLTLSPSDGRCLVEKKHGRLEPTRLASSKVTMSKSGFTEKCMRVCFIRRDDLFFSSCP